MRNLPLIVLAVAVATGAWAAPGGPFADNDDVDRAIERGLAYLASVQNDKGFFPEEYGRTTGVVALGGLAFLAKGYLPGRPPHGEVINRCIDYVLANQTPNGMLARADNRMYSHTISTLFLCEVSGMVDPERQRQLDAALPKAVKLILTAQQVRKDENNRGGWRYAPNSNDSDMSCTGWALMALRSARQNGARVPDQAVAEAVRYIMNHCDKNQGTFGYQDRSGNANKLTGVGLLCLELTGHHGEDVTIKAGEYILRTYENLPSQPHGSYGIYYNAQAMFQLGGKYWSKYADWLSRVCIPRQRPDGSWPRSEIGSAYETAMMVLSLAVPYRQLPIYQRDETVDQKN